MQPTGQRRNWRGFLVGCLLLGGFYWLLGWSGLSEWGVIRRNRELGLSASPLFYTEVENRDLFKTQSSSLDKKTQYGN